MLKDKKNWSDNRFLNWTLLNSFNKFRPYLFQLLCNILRKQRCFSQIRHYMGHIEIWNQFAGHHKFIKCFNDFGNQFFFRFLTKVNHRHYLCDIFKSDTISLIIKKILKYFNKISKFLNCMTNVNPKIGNERKEGIFQWTYSNLISFSVGRKIPKYFSEFYNWHLPVTLQKWT